MQTEAPFIARESEIHPDEASHASKAGADKNNLAIPEDSNDSADIESAQIESSTDKKEEIMDQLKSALAQRFQQPQSQDISAFSVPKPKPASPTKSPEKSFKQEPPMKNPYQ